MIIKVVATRDFRVGPSPGEVVIRKGDVRTVEINDDDKFFTATNTGSFFGFCHLDDGWDLIDILSMQEEEDDV
jgi:hypothetical protein